MKINLRQELPSLLVILIPLIYLATIYSGLPDQIPSHWNVHGEIDDWSHKSMLWLIILIGVVPVYLIMLFVPMIDPKQYIKLGDQKYQRIKLILVLFMSLIMLFITYMAKHQANISGNFILIGVGLFFTLLANYFQTIKPNYFVGIRTPWTLENETVWRKTHAFSGKLWFAGGLLIVISSLLLEGQILFVSMIAIISLLALVPIVYSYLKFKEEQGKGSLN